MRVSLSGGAVKSTARGIKMDLKIGENGIDSYDEMMLIYQSALKKVVVKLEILKDEFEHLQKYNSIEHITSRLKSPESIVNKLRRHNCEPTLQNVVEYCSDIAGARIICSFTSDIYRIADILQNNGELEIVSIKDYLAHPKPSGYRSYHLIVKVPVYYRMMTFDTKVEIQIRTIAMDFWASLEHQIQYKFTGQAPEYIGQELLQCANMVSALDARMLALSQEIQQQSEKEDLRNALVEHERRKAKLKAQDHGGRYNYGTDNQKKYEEEHKDFESKE